MIIKKKSSSAMPLNGCRLSQQKMLLSYKAVSRRGVGCA